MMMAISSLPRIPITTAIPIGLRPQISMCAKPRLRGFASHEQEGSREATGSQSVINQLLKIEEPWKLLIDCVWFNLFGLNLKNHMIELKQILDCGGIPTVVVDLNTYKGTNIVLLD